MKRYIWQIILVAILAALLFSCSSSLRTGKYTIKEINGSSTVVFKEVEGDWHVPRADTLKIGQKVHLKRVYKEKDADVW